MYVPYGFLNLILTRPEFTVSERGTPGTPIQLKIQGETNPVRSQTRPKGMVLPAGRRFRRITQKGRDIMQRKFFKSSFI